MVLLFIFVSHLHDILLFRQIDWCLWRQHSACYSTTWGALKTASNSSNSDREYWAQKAVRRWSYKDTKGCCLRRIFISISITSLTCPCSSFTNILYWFFLINQKLTISVSGSLCQSVQFLRWWFLPFYYISFVTNIIYKYEVHLNEIFRRFSVESWLVMNGSCKSISK